MPVAAGPFEITELNPKTVCIKKLDEIREEISRGQVVLAPVAQEQDETMPRASIEFQRSDFLMSTKERDMQHIVQGIQNHEYRKYRILSTVQKGLVLHHGSRLRFPIYCANRKSQGSRRGATGRWRRECEVQEGLEQKQVMLPNSVPVEATRIHKS